MDNILEIKNVSKKFKDFNLNDVSFKLKSGYIMGFIGPNGAGKSTTIKLIMNLLKRDSGDIKVFGKDNIKHEVEIKERIGFVYDEVNFYEYLKIKEVKNIVAPFYKQWDDNKFKTLCFDFGLNEKKKIKELSKGMKMKFSLALALSHNADFIIMDEPTSGLDPVSRREVLGLFQDIIQDENKSILFSTHITSDLERIADYITFINKGKIIFSDSKDEVLDKHILIKGNRELLNNENRRLLLGIEENSFGFTGLINNKEKALNTFGDDVIIEKPTLEDIMVYTNRKR